MNGGGDDEKQAELQTAGVSRIIKQSGSMIRISPDVHSDLNRVAGYLQWKSGKSVSLNAAIRHLIDKCGEPENQPK